MTSQLFNAPEPQGWPHYSKSEPPNTHPEFGSPAMQPFAKNNRTAESRSTGEELKEGEEQMGQWEGRRHILTNSYQLFYLSAVGHAENGGQGVTEQLGEQMGRRKG